VDEKWSRPLGARYTFISSLTECRTNRQDQRPPGDLKNPRLFRLSQRVDDDWIQRYNRGGDADRSETASSHIDPSLPFAAPEIRRPRRLMADKGKSRVFES
jgi:hypothetical protein